MRTIRETSYKIIASATANLDPQRLSIIILYYLCLQKFRKTSGGKEESGERKMQGGQEKSAVNSDAFSKLFRRHAPGHENFISVGDL